MLAGLLSSEGVGSLFNSCPWEVHCFVAYCVAGELMRGEPIFFLFSICSLLSPTFCPCPAHFTFLQHSSDLFYLPRFLFFPHPSLSFSLQQSWSQKSRKCTQHLPSITLSLPCLSGMETPNRRSLLSITSRQRNQSDL